MGSSTPSSARRAVYGTLQAKEQLEKPKAEKVEFVEMKKKEEPPPPKEVPPPPKDVVMAPPPPKGFQVLTAPVKVPDVLPDIDLSKKVTDEADFSGKGVAGGIAQGRRRTAPVNTDQPFFEFQVEKQVQQIPGSGNLRYPDMLRSANVEGEVLAQFVVDTSGKYESGQLQGPQVQSRSVHGRGQERAADHALLSGRGRRAQGEAARPAAVHVLAPKELITLRRLEDYGSVTRRHVGRMGNFAKGIVIVMALMSVYSLTIMVSKWWNLRAAQEETRKFAPEFSQFLEEDNLTEAIKLAESYKKSHVALVLGGALGEVRPLIQDGSVTVSDINSAERAVERNMLLEITQLKRGLAVLATVGATAPFVGLLGTTIGIINSFSAMSASGGGGLASIGAGISEALATTAFGLLVAIPAVWAYNYFQTKIDNLTAEMTYVSKEMIDYLIKGVSGEFGRSRFTREFNASSGGNAPIST